MFAEIFNNYSYAKYLKINKTYADRHQINIIYIYESRKKKEEHIPPYKTFRVFLTNIYSPYDTNEHSC